MSQHQHVSLATQAQENGIAQENHVLKAYPEDAEAVQPAKCLANKHDD